VVDKTGQPIKTIPYKCKKSTISSPVITDVKINSAAKTVTGKDEKGVSQTFAANVCSPYKTVDKVGGAIVKGSVYSCTGAGMAGMSKADIKVDTINFYTQKVSGKDKASKAQASAAAKCTKAVTQWGGAVTRKNRKMKGGAESLYTITFNKSGLDPAVVTQAIRTDPILKTHFSPNDTVVITSGTVAAPGAPGAAPGAAGQTLTYAGQTTTLDFPPDTPVIVDPDTYDGPDGTGRIRFYTHIKTGNTCGDFMVRVNPTDYRFYRICAATQAKIREVADQVKAKFASSGSIDDVIKERQAKIRSFESTIKDRRAEIDSSKQGLQEATNTDKKELEKLIQEGEQDLQFYNQQIEKQKQSIAELQKKKTNAAAKAA
jgi:hypothetical protein